MIQPQRASVEVLRRRDTMSPAVIIANSHRLPVDPLMMLQAAKIKPLFVTNG